MFCGIEFYPHQSFIKCIVFTGSAGVVASTLADNIRRSPLVACCVVLFSFVLRAHSLSAGGALFAMQVSCFLNASQAAINAKEWGDAIAHASSALSKDPDNVKALFRRGSARQETSHAPKWFLVLFFVVYEKNNLADTKTFKQGYLPIHEPGSTVVSECVCGCSELIASVNGAYPLTAAVPCLTSD